MSAEPFTTELGVQVRFVGSTAAAPATPRRPASTKRGEFLLLGSRKSPRDRIRSQPTEPRSLTASPTLSYTALLDLRAVRLPLLRAAHARAARPADATVAGEDGEQPLSLRPAASRRGISGAQRGTIVHQLLATMDLRNPSLHDPMPTDVRALSPDFSAARRSARIFGPSRSATRAALCVPDRRDADNRRL